MEYENILLRGAIGQSPDTPPPAPTAQWEEGVMPKKKKMNARVFSTYVKLT
jgi:hypothetical protein